METLGGDGEPSESDLDITGVGHGEQQQEPSPPVTSAEPFPLLLDEPDVVDGDDSGVAVRREPSVTEEFGGSDVLGFGTQQQREKQQQQREKQQQQQTAEPVAVGAVAASNGPGEVQTMPISSGTGSIGRVVLQQKGGLGQRGASTRPFDPGTPEEEQGDYSSSGSSSSNSSSTSSSTSSSKRLDQKWDGTASFPFDRGKISRALPRHVIHRL